MQFWTYAAPVLAIVLTIIGTGLIFKVLGQTPGKAVYTFLVVPLLDSDGLSALVVKAAPLILIGTGLSLCYRANVWNIGSEGQFTLGAIFAGGLALAFPDAPGWALYPLMIVMGIIGGAAAAAIVAYLKTALNVNEILASLMLTYVMQLLLIYLVSGPWRDPQGFGFPQTALFSDGATSPIIVPGTTVHLGCLIAPLVAILVWFLLSKSVLGFQLRVVGQAPRAARFAGFKEVKLVWIALLISGGLSGLAGMFEVAGPVGQLTASISPGYGFTAVIVAFLGRLHPIGAIFAGLLLALSYLGGDAAQIDLGLPNAVTGIFQGILLFFLLACDILILYRPRLIRAKTGKIGNGSMIFFLTSFFVSMIAAATPLLLAASGELVAEKAGVLNLGVEGMMLVGAVVGFAVSHSSGSTFLGAIAAALAGIGISLIFSFLTLTLLSNQIAAGLALTIFGKGFSALMGKSFVGIAGPTMPRLHIPFVSDVPFFGPVLFGHDALVYLSFLMIGGIAYFLYRTHAGLVLRAVGDSHTAAHAIGYSVIPIRYAATAFGGALAGLAGGYMSLSYSPLWAENMTAGRGWIALALVVFAAWRPSWVLAGAYLFGGIMYLSLYVQGLGIPIPSPFVSALPYIGTIVVLAIISRDRRKIRLNQPACLGKSFHAMA